MKNKHLCIGLMSFLIILTLICIVVFLIVHLNTYNERVLIGPKMIIDHDGGADGAMAIFLALLHEQFFNGPTVIGLTTVFGNVDEDQCFVNSQRILNIINRTDVPIYRGSKEPLIHGIESDNYFGADGLGDIEHEYFETIEPQSENAALALIRLSKLYEGDLIIVAIGAMTNIALAIKLDPEFINRLSHLYVGAGNIYSANVTEAEFNAAMDPESYYIISQNANPEKVTVIPFSSIDSSLETSKEWRETVLGAIPTKTMQVQNKYEQVSAENSTNWLFLDPAVMSIALNSNVVDEIKYSNNSILLCGNERGINTNTYNIMSTTNANVQLLYSANRDEYKAFLIDVFSAELYRDVDELDHYGLYCRRSAGSLPRHAAYDVIRRALATVNLPAILKPNSIARDDSMRPDGMTLISWRFSKSLVWDATCVDTLAASHIQSTSRERGRAAATAEGLKRRKYAALDKSYVFVPRVSVPIEPL
ncbi:inosine-uridine preferring nucleoside hydrolase-like [Aphomia sociella]